MPTFSNNVFMTSRDWMSKCRKTKLKLLRIAVGIFIMGYILSCVPYKNVDFQIMRPSQIKLGADYKNVIIHCEYCSDSSSIAFLDSASKLKARVSLNFIYTLQENLQKSPLFADAKVQIYNYDSISRFVKDKSRLQNNGLLIILDSIYLKDTLILQKIRYQEYLYSSGIIHKFGCRTYNISKLDLLDDYLYEDTVFWTYNNMESYQYYAPTLDEAIWDTGIKAGFNYSHYLAPYWEEQTRMFFYGNHRSFKTAYRLIQMNQLDSALHILNSDPIKPKDKVKIGKKLYNKAILFELKDDLQNAYIMADSAAHVSDKKTYKDYCEKIRLRKLDKIALDWQLTP